MSGMVDMLLTAALSPMYSIKSCGGAAIGTSEKWEALLKTDALQKFRAEADKASANGGPRNDQEYRFNCKLQAAYPLHFAAMIGDVGAVKALIEASPGAVNVKCVEMGDERAVGLAATYGQLKVVIALLMVRFLRPRYGGLFGFMPLLTRPCRPFRPGPTPSS